MRWDSLFDDLEGQLEQELVAEGDELRAEEERLRVGRLTMRDRILAAGRSGAPLRLRLTSGEAVTLRAAAVGRDWLSGEEAGGGILVPLGAVAALLVPAGAVPETLHPPAEPERGLTGRLSFPFVLRDLARRRIPVAVAMSARTVPGTIDRVGRDQLDLAVHERDVPRRAAAVPTIEVIALAAVLAVRVP
ncbi:hypothetical protein [Naasia aerilata]|uniref:Fis family transcriptional regulator n=1 Tax=Naasia aerilata TaxID=1162966 RepID=A0ABM8GCN3_9MICO|nr:hypothetical protein [Naasia aerilata]BDZ46009.1 hypothetical protein GCM10025866_19180 [Naasia aerilata]